MVHPTLNYSKNGLLPVENKCCSSDISGVKKVCMSGFFGPTQTPTNILLALIYLKQS